MEYNKNAIRWIALVLFAVILIVVGSIVHDSRRQADTDSRDVLRTIQDIKDESNTVRTELGNARTELERGQERITDAEATTRRLQDSSERSGELIENSRRIVGEIRDEFRAIDEANGIYETQAGSKE